jgi:hypothetical protein
MSKVQPKLEKNSCRKMKHIKCSFEADRGTVAVLNVEGITLIRMKSSNSPHPSMTDVYSNR